MHKYYYLTRLDESPYQLTLLDALHFGVTERLGIYALAEYEITLRNPDTGAEESGKGFYLKLCASTLQQIEKETSKAEHQPPLGYVSERPRQSQCYNVREAFIDHRRLRNHAAQSADAPEIGRLVLLYAPNGDPFIACLPDLILWARDLEELAKAGRIQRRSTASDTPQDLPEKFQQLYGAIAGGELPDLKAAIDAWYSQWVELADRGQRDTYPTNAAVQKWLENRQLTRNRAESIPPLIRPKWATRSLKNK